MIRSSQGSQSSLLAVPIFLVCIVAIQTVSFAQDSDPNLVDAPPKLIAITGCNLVSIETGELQTDQTILIGEGTIISVGPLRNAAIGPSAVIIDGANKYVMPGLVDMHIHLGDESELLLYLVNGVTSVCNMGGDYVDLFSDQRIDILRLKKQIATGQVIGPTIYSAGQALDGDPRTGPYQRALSGVAAAAEAVFEQKEAGFDFIKIYDAVDQALLKAIVRTAAETKLAVVGHIPEEVGVNKTLESGVKLIAHAEEFYPAFADSDDFDQTARELAQQVKRSGVAVTPNTAFIRRMIDQLEDLPAVLADERFKNLSPRVRRWWNPRYNYYTNRDDLEAFLSQTKRKYEWLIPFVRELHSAGVPLLTGTDASVPGALPGDAMWEEFKDLQMAGLSPLEILQTATINSAKFICDHAPPDREFGKIQKGCRADLILLEKNPLDNLQDLSDSIVGVVANGRWLTTETLRKMIAADVEKFED